MDTSLVDVAMIIVDVVVVLVVAVDDDVVQVVVAMSGLIVWLWLLMWL